MVLRSTLSLMLAFILAFGSGCSTPRAKPQVSAEVGPRRVTLKDLSRPICPDGLEFREIVFRDCITQEEAQTLEKKKRELWERDQKRLEEARAKKEAEPYPHEDYKDGNYKFGSTFDFLTSSDSEDTAWLFVVLAAVPLLLYATDEEATDDQYFQYFDKWYLDARVGGVVNANGGDGFRLRLDSRYRHTGLTALFENFRGSGERLTFQNYRYLINLTPSAVFQPSISLGYASVTGSRNLKGVQLGFPMRFFYSSPVSVKWDVFFNFFGAGGTNLYEFQFDIEYQPGRRGFVISPGYRFRLFSGDVFLHGPHVELGWRF